MGCEEQKRRMRVIALPSHPDHFEKDEERRRRMWALWKPRGD